MNESAQHLLGVSLYQSENACGLVWDPEELEGLLGEVIAWFRQHEGSERLRRLFAEIVHKAFAPLAEDHDFNTR